MFTRPDFAIDAGIWQECCVHNGYRMDRLNEKAPVVDIGGHIGCFALMALCHGATNIHSYEADPRNFLKLQANVAPFGGMIKAHHLAVWRSDVDVGTLPIEGFDAGDPNANTGGSTVVSGVANGALPAPTAIKLDAIINELDYVQLLKLDCEGSEYPILYTSKELGRVGLVVAEVHSQFQFSMEAVVPGKHYTVEGLAAFLLSAEGGGFREIRYVPHKVHTFLTMLWALR